MPNPATPTGPILTLSPEEISRFFVRARRGDQDTMRWDVRLDGALREILERANEFVPSESGGILLDDPRAKLAGAPAPRLTFIAAFGPGRESMLGVRVPSDRGFAGQIYRSGQPLQTDHVEADDPIRGVAPQGSSIRTLVGVPVIVGESICGVLALSNRRSGGAYTPRDRELLRIFAAYMSSSIQNALDAIRARAQARIDDLTGLFNSRYFHTPARRRDRARRSRRHRPVRDVHRPRSFQGGQRPLRPPGGQLDAAEGRAAASRKRARRRGARALRRRRVRHHPAGREPAARAGDRRIDAQRHRRSELLRAQHRGDAQRPSPGSPRRSGSRPIATTWRRAERSAGARTSF